MECDLEAFGLEGWGHADVDDEDVWPLLFDGFGYSLAVGEGCDHVVAFVGEESG